MNTPASSTSTGVAEIDLSAVAQNHPEISGGLLTVALLAAIFRRHIVASLTPLFSEGDKLEARSILRNQLNATLTLRPFLQHNTTLTRTSLYIIHLYLTGKVAADLTDAERNTLSSRYTDMVQQIRKVRSASMSRNGVTGSW